MMNSTLQKSMFQQHLRHVPAIAEDDWLLIIDGAVTRSLTLKYSSLPEFPAQTLTCTLACVGHSPETPMLAEAEWTGVAVSTLLEQVQPTNTAAYINFHSADGYATSLSLDEAANSVLVYKLDNNPLPAEHGYPIRLMHPHKAGYKLPKWIQHIVISDTPVMGFWEQRGWDTVGNLTPITALNAISRRISVNQPIVFSGVAHGGRSAIERIDIRVDGGLWNPIHVTGTDSGTLTHWESEWQTSIPGTYRVQVRAVASDGQIQPEATQPFVTIQVNA